MKKKGATPFATTWCTISFSKTG
ncbi:hypothetical protein LINGRAHAP2_LOCUS30541 [Linum grandiflorum]